ncbi:unnamed protein product [Anisakis simplex]|uniref:Glyoxylate reductase/hydroxypyruvate reductase n=2 Tax=Anisakis simplex TaxID=6269 RepID=A0A0M3J0I0_ANISI|nr:unnamed protein product [Anisakis simplex]
MGQAKSAFLRSTSAGASVSMVSAEKVSVDAPTVLVTDSTVNLSRLCECSRVFQYMHNGKMPRDLLMQQIANVDALYCMVRDKIDKEVLEAAKNLKIIATMSVGFDHIDIDECKKRNIVVTNTPDVLTETTAELTVALLLATARRLCEGVADVKNGRWGTWEPFYMCGVGLYESTIGVIGLGRIGCSVIEKLKSFHPNRIVYNDIQPIEKRASQLGVKYVKADELLSESDFIVMTCSMNASNRHFINKETLSKMKKNAIFINTSRGGLVNQDDLYEALKEGRIRAAGIDVTDPEPMPTNHPLLTLPNCVVLPHIGSATMATRQRMMELAEEAILHTFNKIQIPDSIRVV